MYIGTSPCTSLILQDSTSLSCTAPPSVVGRFPVTVSLNNVTSSGSVWLDRVCGADRFGMRGERCGPCPQVRLLYLSSPTSACGRVSRCVTVCDGV